jgi:hypothetical protein
MASSAPPKRRVIVTNAPSTASPRPRLQRPPSSGTLKARVNLESPTTSIRPSTPNRSCSPVARPQPRSPFASSVRSTVPTINPRKPASSPSGDAKDHRRRISLGSSLPPTSSRSFPSPTVSSQFPTTRLRPPSANASHSDSSPLSPTLSTASTSSSSSGLLPGGSQRVSAATTASSIPRPVSPLRRPASPSRRPPSPVRAASPVAISGYSSPSLSPAYAVFGGRSPSPTGLASKSPTSGEIDIVDLDLASIPQSEWKQRLKEVEAAREREREARVNRKARSLLYTLFSGYG